MKKYLIPADQRKEESFLAKGRDRVQWLQQYTLKLLPILHWLWFSAILVFFGVRLLQRSLGWFSHRRLALRLQWSALLAAATITATALLPSTAAMLWVIPLGIGMVLFWATAALPPRWLQLRKMRRQWEQGRVMENYPYWKSPWPNEFAVERWYREMLVVRTYLLWGQPLQALRLLEHWSDKELFPWERRWYLRWQTEALLAIGYPDKPVVRIRKPGKISWTRAYCRQQQIAAAIATSQMYTLQGDADTAAGVLQDALTQLADPDWQPSHTVTVQPSQVFISEDLDNPLYEGTSSASQTEGIDPVEEIRSEWAQTSDVWPLYQSLGQRYWDSWERQRALVFLEYSLALALASPQSAGMSGPLFRDVFVGRYEQTGPRAASSIWNRYYSAVKKHVDHGWGRLLMFQAALSCPDAVPWGPQEFEDIGAEVWQLLPNEFRIAFLNESAADIARGDLDPDPWLVRYLEETESLRRSTVETRSQAYRSVLTLLNWYKGRAHSFAESLERPAQNYFREQAVDDLKERFEDLPQRAIDLRAWCLRERIAITREYAPQRHPQRQIYQDYQRLLNLYEWAGRPRDAWETELSGLEHAIDGLDDLSAQKLLRVLSARCEQWANHPSLPDDHLRLAYCATRLNDLDAARYHWRLLEENPHPASGFRPDPERFWVDEYMQVVAAYLRPGLG